jgi:hypothetical protein
LCPGHVGPALIQQLYRTDARDVTQAFRDQAENNGPPSKDIQDLKRTNTTKRNTLYDIKRDKSCREKEA